MRKIIILSVAVVLALLAVAPVEARRRQKSEAVALQSRKYEFRGAWVQTVFQDRYSRRSAEQCRAYMKALVDGLHDAGFNAVIFQVRSEGDAFYDSDIEPWSRFLTGRRGVAPRNVWDPLQCMVELCHERHMELHAWINPYRMTASKGMGMKDHPLYREHPEYFVQYQGRWYLNPGLPESRAYIREVVGDIVRRYDVDGIHLDDYFYPYPDGGAAFDDGEAFRAYAPLMEIDPDGDDALGDFRRRSVNILIKYLHDDIRQRKPWVRFGVSPFGIYRNARTAEGGSDTRGTQCYDDLYADVLLWARAGWVDYVAPQLYWEIGHPAADYNVLARWWADNVPSTCQLYIGESIERSRGSLSATTPPATDTAPLGEHFYAKIGLARQQTAVDGLCFWYAYQVEENKWGVRDVLRSSVFERRALVPPLASGPRPSTHRVESLSAARSGESVRVAWQPDSLAQTYNVYKFTKADKTQSTDDIGHLLLQTETPEFFDYDVERGQKYTYVVVPVDRWKTEGEAASVTIKIKKR